MMKINGTIAHLVFHPCKACKQRMILNRPFLLRFYIVVLRRIFRSVSQSRPIDACSAPRGTGITILRGVAVADVRRERVFLILIAQFVDVLLALSHIAEKIPWRDADIIAIRQEYRPRKCRISARITQISDGVMVRILIRIVHIGVAERTAGIKVVIHIKEDIFT